MDPLEVANLPADAPVQIDSAPIIYFLEGHPRFGPRFEPLRLKLADAVQAASALAINAAALVTHDRDFSRVRALRIIS